VIFRHKPVEVEAVRWNGGNWGDIEVFLAARNNPSVLPDGNCLTVATGYGVVKVFPGDWLIRNTHGELYPCAHDVFLAGYEGAE
jgi:hypothetical protein